MSVDRAVARACTDQARDRESEPIFRRVADLRPLTQQSQNRSLPGNLRVDWLMSNGGLLTQACREFRLLRIKCLSVRYRLFFGFEGLVSSQFASSPLRYVMPRSKTAQLKRKIRPTRPHRVPTPLR